MLVRWTAQTETCPVVSHILHLWYRRKHKSLSTKNASLVSIAPECSNAACHLYQTDRRSTSLIAKIAKQTALYYSDTISTLQGLTSVDRKWLATCLTKKVTFGLD